LKRGGCNLHGDGSHPAPAARHCYANWSADDWKAQFGLRPRFAATHQSPSEAIIFNRNGLQVVVVEHGKAEIRKVNETRDMGTQVEVDAGVKAGDQAILNPPVTLIDGAKVQLRSTESRGASA
jgi:hypothetical protein